jgi:hypothetical protein
MTTFEDPVTAIVRKLKSDATLLALLPASHIHSSYPDAASSNPSIYIFVVRVQRKPALSSGNQTDSVYNGTARFQIEAYDKDSLENAITLGRVACERAGPSLIVAGIWNFEYQMRGGDWDSTVNAFRATYFLDSSCTEWRGSA